MPITLRGDEIGLALNALDFYSRIWIGQYEEILWIDRMYFDFDKIKEIEGEVRTYLQYLRLRTMPELGPSLNGSYGIYNPIIDLRSSIAYNMQQVIRYKYAWARFPEGGIGVDFGKPMQCGKTPLPDGEIHKEGDEWVISIEGKTEEDTERYRSVLLDSLIIRKYTMDVDVVSLFKYYTDNEDALRFAEKIQEVYDKIEKTEMVEEEGERCRRLIEKIKQIMR